MDSIRLWFSHQNTPHKTNEFSAVEGANLDVYVLFSGVALSQKWSGFPKTRDYGRWSPNALIPAIVESARLSPTPMHLKITSYVSQVIGTPRGDS